jgi:hypothetical protein
VPDDEPQCARCPEFVEEVRHVQQRLADANVIRFRPRAAFVHLENVAVHLSRRPVGWARPLHKVRHWYRRPDRAQWRVAHSQLLRELGRRELVASRDKVAADALILRVLARHGDLQFSGADENPGTASHAPGCPRGLLNLPSIQPGKTLQLWLVELTNAEHKVVARGQVRLFNQPLAQR